MNAAEWEAVRARIATLGREPDAADIADALRWCGQVVSDASVLAVARALHRDSVGAGRLEPLLALPGVTDVLVNGPHDVYVDTGEGLRKVEIRFDSDEDVRRLAVRLAASVGRRLDDASPFVDARMADGTRVHAILGGLADAGTCLSLRIPSRSRLSLGDWVASGTCHPEVAVVLERMVAAKAAFLVSGGTGSGKTTLLASLLGLVPPTERIVVVEDSRELAPDHPHCLRLEGRVANAEGAGAITMTQLVRQALRMRPDRIVVGEVRGAELVDLLIALNTGHEGGCGTVHANTPESVPARLEALAALGGLGREAAHSQIAAALRAVVHLVRDVRGRRVSAVAVLGRSPGGFVEARPALAVSSDGRLRRLGGLTELETILGTT
ncbi:MAG TPA: TadA family conjugal transfer-associated ATPase [Propionibacteriaceae bacterium]|nr:TadA family conjugal transfer-associated ATPase [Propionibacteriaceae bacterium]